MSFRRIDKTPMTWYDFVEPLAYAARPCVMLPAVAYAMEFLWTSIMTTVEIPQLFPELFGFNTQQNGLQMISVIVGTIVGEQIGGRMSDLWMSMRRRKLNGRSPQPEYRLWLSYFGFALCIIGIVVFLVQLYNAGHTWNVTPLIGVGIAAAGNQVVTTVLVTYSVDCYRQDAASVGVFITFVRQIWGFIGPFWYVFLNVSLFMVTIILTNPKRFPQSIEEVGYRETAGIAVASKFISVFITHVGIPRHDGCLEQRMPKLFLKAWRGRDSLGRIWTVMIIQFYEPLMIADTHIYSDGCVQCHSNSSCPVEGTVMELRRHLSAPFTHWKELVLPAGCLRSSRGLKPGGGGGNYIQK